MDINSPKLANMLAADDSELNILAFKIGFSLVDDDVKLGDWYEIVKKTLQKRNVAYGRGWYHYWTNQKAQAWQKELNLAQDRIYTRAQTEINNTLKIPSDE